MAVQLRPRRRAMARWLPLLPPLLLLSNICLDTSLAAAAAADSVAAAVAGGPSYHEEDIAVSGEAPTKSAWVWACERQSCEEACKEYNNQTKCRDETQVDQQTWDDARWTSEAEMALLSRFATCSPVELK